MVRVKKENIFKIEVKVNILEKDIKFILNKKEVRLN